MRDGGRGAAGAVRVVAAVGALLLLCVVVAAASVGRTEGAASSAPFDSRAAATLFAAVSFLVLAGFLAMAIGVLLKMLRSDKDDPEEKEQASGLEVTTPLWLQRLIVAGIVVMTALCCWVTWILIQAFLSSTPPPDAVTPGAPPPSPVATTEVTGDVLPNLAAYVLAAMVIALLALTIAVALRRPADDDDAYVLTEHEMPTDRAELEGDPFAVDLDALGREEPRSAVIVSFALAQRMLGASGFGAQWEETSAEHVHRVGPTLPGAAPPALDHLLLRYHEAKFSDHPIPAQHRSDALAALALLRDTLAPLSLTAATTS
jgi:hypothetical protein